MSNPFSTGGGGVTFEQRVGAAFVATFLCGAPCPCFHNNKIESIRFQSKQAGHSTDDLLIKTVSAEGAEAKLLVQIKHRLVATAENSEFKETIERAWSDYSSAGFDKNDDRIAFITGPATARTLQHLRGLFDLAKYSASADEFFAKINNAGFASKQKQEILQIISGHVKEVSSGATTEDIWGFIKCIDFLSYDFDIERSSDEARTLALIELNRGDECQESARALWSQIITFSQTANLNSATLTRGNVNQLLPENVSNHLLKNSVIMHSKDIRRLLEHSEVTLDHIKTEICDGVTLEREGLIEKSLALLEKSKVLLITSEAGSGKSALAKMLIKRFEDKTPVLAFRVEEFDHPHLDQALTSMGASCTLKDLSTNLGMLPNRVLFIDSIERLLEMDHQEAFSQLIKLSSQDEKTLLVMTCRSYAETTIQQILCAQQLVYSLLRVPGLNEDEIREVCKKIPTLKTVTLTPTLKEIFKNPFFLSMAARSLPESVEGLGEDTDAIRQVMWSEIIRYPKNNKDGLPERREKLFCEIAVERAKTMQPYVHVDVVDHAAMAALLSDNVIEKNEAGFYAPSHDLFEDVGVESYVERAFQKSQGDYQQLFSAIGPEPAMRRAFRNWLVRSLRSNNSQLEAMCIQALSDSKIEQFWQDEVLVSILKSDEAGAALSKLKTGLLANKKELLKRAIHLLRTACKAPNTGLMKSMGLDGFMAGEIGLLLTQPYGGGWAGTIKLIADNLSEFDLRNDVGIVSGLLKDWAASIEYDKPVNDTQREAAKICLHFHNLLIEDDALYSRLDTTFAKILLKFPMAAPEGVRKIFHDVFVSEHSRDKGLVEFVLTSFEAFPLIKDFPDIVLRCLDEYAAKDTRPADPFIGRHHSPIDLDHYFGLGEMLHIWVHPSSALFGPFRMMFKFHPDAMLDYLISFANKAVTEYEGSGLDGALEKIKFTHKGVTREILASNRLWGMFRGFMPSPHLLECGTMALEAWLLDSAKEGIDITPHIEKIYTQTNSVLFISVLASVANAYPQSFEGQFLPLFSDIALFRYDQIRQIHEGQHISDVRGFLGMPTRGGIEDIYYNERKASNELAHRSKDLQTLAAQLQYAKGGKEVREHIDQLVARHIACEDENESTAEKMIIKRIQVSQWTETPVAEGYIEVGPKIEEPDLVKAVEDSQKNLKTINAWAKMRMWAVECFRDKEKAKTYFSTPEEALSALKKLDAEKVTETNSVYKVDMDIVGLGSSALIRNFMDELKDDDFKWCVENMCASIEATAASKNRHDWYSKNETHGSRPAALLLPKALERTKLDKSLHDRANKAVNLGLVSLVDEVKHFSVMGINSYLSDTDPERVKQSQNALLWISQETGPYLGSKWNHKNDFSTIYYDKSMDAYKKLNGKKPFSAVTKIDVAEMERRDLLHALKLGNKGKLQQPEVDRLVEIAKQLAEAFREADEDRDGKSRLSGDHEFHHAFYKLYAQAMFAVDGTSLSHLLNTLIEIVDISGKMAEGIVEDLITEADGKNETKRFWTIWGPLTAKVFSSGGKSWRRADLIKAVLFARSHWKADAKSWKPIEDNQAFFPEACEMVGHTVSGFSALTRLLTGIGSFLLPMALIPLATAYSKAETDLLSDEYARGDLELVLRKAVFGFGGVIRSNKELRISTLQLLDALINKGSSISYLLRELLIAPSRKVK